MPYKTFADVDLSGKRVLIREDFNVPLKEGKITSDARIRAALPTLKRALQEGAHVIVMSHLGRPKEGEFDPALSLQPVADALEPLLGVPVELVSNWQAGFKTQPKHVYVCENVRFAKGEKACDPVLSAKMASLCDVFVMDAFAAAHREHASTYGVAQKAKVTCAGPLLCKELETLEKALMAPARPLLAIIGGAKVSTKLSVLNALIPKVDGLIVGGGMANTFLAAQGHAVGTSLYEPDLLKEAKRLIALADKRHTTLLLPVDVRVAEALSDQAEPQVRAVTDVDDEEAIFDIGPKTEALFAEHIKDAGCIIWNGPVGVFECAPFAAGTQALANAVAKSAAFSIAGGGDTLAAIDQFGIASQVSYVSTGGGAFLEWMEHNTLPGVSVLETQK